MRKVEVQIRPYCVAQSPNSQSSPADKEKIDFPITGNSIFVLNGMKISP